MKKGFFVTGTDTGIGKTTVSCALLGAFSAHGLKAAGMKPVSAAGDDIQKLMAASSVATPISLSNPYAFSEPIAPHIAARRAGVEIDIEKIRQAYLRIEADAVIVEGIGGFLVPLNESQDTGDLAKLLGLPVIVVVGMRLGAINHALSTALCVKSKGLHLAGWVANAIDPNMQAFDEVRDSIGKRLEAPCLGSIPFSANCEPDGALLDISRLLR